MMRFLRGARFAATLIAALCLAPMLAAADPPPAADASLIWRDYNVDGVSASGVYNPQKSQIRTFMGDLAGAVNAMWSRANTNAQLMALPSTYSSVVVRNGYNAAGDTTPLSYISSNAACALNGGAGDGGSQVPTADGKCWLAVFPGRVDLSQFGVFPGAANDTQMQYAFNAAAAAGVPLVFDKATGVLNPASPSNCYQVASAIILPSALGGGTTWEFNNPFTMRGPADSKYRACIHNTADVPAQFYNATLGSTVNRVANAGLVIHGLDFIGPQSWSNGACALGLDNQRTLDLSDATFVGYIGLTTNAINSRGGCAAIISSYKVGGSFGVLIQRTQHGFQHYSSLAGGNNVYSFEDLRVWGMRNGFILNGPYEAAGKVNDTTFRDNRYECTLVSDQVVAGSGTWSASAGAAQNTVAERGFYTSYCSHAMEKGSLSAVTDASHMTLRTTPGSYIFSGSDFTSTPTGAPTVLRVSDANGRYWASYIASASGRTITLATPLPFTPASDAPYEVGYSDSLAQTTWPTNPLAIGHAWFYEQGTGFKLTDRDGYFENSQMLIAGGSSTSCYLASPQVACSPPNAQNDVRFENPNTAVMRGQFAMYEDGTPFMPKGLKSSTEIYIGGVVTAEIIKNAIVGDPTFFTNQNSLSILAMNATGHALYPGDVVVIDNNGGGAGKLNAIDPSGSTTNYKCRIVTAPTGAGSPVYTAGNPVPLALPGFRVKMWIYSPTSTAPAVGDEATAQAPVAGKGNSNGTGLNVPLASVTVAQLSNSCGKIEQSTSGIVANDGTSLWVTAR